MKSKNVLIEIGHPAHVHVFSEAIERLRRAGYGVTIVSRDKDITNHLLERKGFPFICLSKARKGKLRLLLELVIRWAKTYHIIGQQKIGLAISMAGITTAFPARLRGIRNIAFQDTEDAVLSNRIAFTFADEVWTPAFFTKQLGKKHRTFNGLKELSYLQRFDFNFAAAIRKRMGLLPPYSIIRVVANNALHDSDVRGLSDSNVLELVTRLSAHGKVYICSERPLPSELDPYRLNIPLEHIHAVLEGAQLFVGESPTMAVESGILGTPAFLFSQRVGRLGNMIELEKLGLLSNSPSWEDLVLKLDHQKDLVQLKEAWKARATQFRNSVPRMDDFIYSLIVKGLPNNPQVLA